MSEGRVLDFLVSPASGGWRENIMSLEELHSTRLAGKLLGERGRDNKTSRKSSSFEG